MEGVRHGFSGWMAACCALVGLLSAPSVGAQESTPPENKWQFEVTPYVFASGIDGTIGVRGVEADVDVSFSDLEEYIDSAFMFAFEANKRRWVFGFDAIYVKLEDNEASSVTGSFGKVTRDRVVDTTVTQEVYTLMAGYRVLDKKTKLDVFGAARYTRLDTELDLKITTTAAMFPGGARSISGDESWWDPVVGARVLWPFAKHWTLLAYADVGGSGSGSDRTYQSPCQ